MRKLFERFGEAKVKDIQDALERNKINASGRLSRSVRSEVSEPSNGKIRLQISALAYIATVDIGRQPTQNRGSGEFTVQMIQDWIVAKRIKTPAGLTLKSFAFIIWRKINREGTVQYRKGNNRKIVEDELNKGLDDFVQELAENNFQNISTQIAKWQRL